MTNQNSPIGTYIVVYVALLILLIATVAAAFFDLGMFNLLLAVGIALIKALLIVLFFMHIKGSSGLMKLFVGAGLLWLFLMFVLTLSDYASRMILTG